MRVIKAKNYDDLSNILAGYIEEHIKNKNSMICLPSGDTPIGAYNKLVDIFKERPNEVRCEFIGLDEWVGMNKSDEGSCQYYMNKFLFSPLNIPNYSIIEFNAKSDDLNVQTEIMDWVIKSHGGLDLVVLGIGMNGHLGLNEPGTSFDSYCHVTSLDNKTIQVAQKYFNSDTKLSHGITVGLKHFLESKQLILVASGEKKKDIIKQIVEGEISQELPASICKLHPNCILLVDEDSLSCTNIPNC